MDLFLPDETATRTLGAQLGALLRPGDIVCLSGPLGAGKTTLARGVIAQLTGAQEAPSPTYPLVEVYPAPGFDLWHFDLYRIARAADAYELGLEEAFASGAALIEWPERIAALVPDAALVLRFASEGAGRRVVFDADDPWRRRLAEAGIMTDG